MTLQMQLRAAIAAVFMALAFVSGNACSQEVPLITGEHWTRSSEELKKVYLIGMANLVQVEAAFSSPNPAADTQSMVPRLIKGLKGHTMDSVREGLNKWYAANPDRLQRPVIETLWFEMVVPGLQQAK